MPWSRINSLVDGIFGFSATVLMLRLATPIYERGKLGAALVEQAPSYFLYGLGFVQIVGAWSVLRRVSSWTIGVDFYGMLLTFITLMMWATLPFTLDILAGAWGNEADVVSITRLMSLTLLVGMVAFTALWWRLERLGSFRDGLDPEMFAFARLVVYTVSAWPVTAYLLTYVNVWASLGVYIGSALLSLIPLEAMTTEMYAED
jgi:uncharacterized membrane protein